MFLSKYFLLIISYNLIRLNEAWLLGYQSYKESLITGLGPNFLLEGYLSYKDSEVTKKWLIEESVFGDEKNSIVTLINEENEGIEIKVFRDFKTKNISLVCVQNQCAWNGDLLDNNLLGFTPQVTQVVKDTLLLGLYRIISCSSSSKNEYNSRSRLWKSYLCGTLYFDHNIRDYGAEDWIEYMIIRDSDNRDLFDHRYHEAILILYLKQAKQLEKANNSMPTKGIHYKFNESITKYNELEVDKENGATQLFITSLDSVTAVDVIDKQFHLELVYDRKFGLTYIPFGLNECTIESTSVDDEFNYFTSEHYGKVFLKPLYFLKNPVKSYSKKLMFEAEYNLTFGAVKYDLAIKTYLEPLDTKSFLENVGRSQDFCVRVDLYKNSVKNKISSDFNLTEVRVICLIKTWDYLDEDEFHRMISSYHQCFKDRQDKVVLHLKISLTNHLMANKIHELQADIHRIKDELRRMLIDKLNISFLRINWIKLNFLNSHIMAKVEIVDSFATYFETKKGASNRFSIKSAESGQIYTSTIDECLRIQANKVNLSYVITCKTGDYSCLGIAGEDSLPDVNENGLNCMLFNNSDRSLTRLLAEVSLKELRKSYFNVNGSQFNYSDINFAVVDASIEDDAHLNIFPEKPKTNLVFPFLFVLSILINILMFVKFALRFRPFQLRQIHALSHSISFKLSDLNN